MTDVHTDESGTLVAALEMAAEWLSQLSGAASTWSTNRRWLTSHHVDTVPLLDFDMICGASRTISLASRTNREDPCETSLPDPVTPLGPAALRLLLAQLPRFCIPPGSKYELLYWKEKLLDAATKEGQALLSIFDRAQRAPDPVRFILESSPSRKVTTVLRDHLEKLAGPIEDLELLDSILTRSTPVEEFVISKEYSTAEVCDFAQSRLRKTRPKYTRSNFRDAVNVATLSLIYNSGLRSQLAPTILPILVSRTSRLTDLHAYQRDFDLPTSNEARLITSDFYLHVHAGLTQFYHGFDLLALNEAYLIESTSRSLRDVYIHCADAVRKNRWTKQECFGTPDWQSLCIAQQRFNGRWKEILAPIQHAETVDLQGTRLQLDNPVVRYSLKRLSSHKPDKVHSAISELRDLVVRQVKTNSLLDGMLFSSLEARTRTKAQMLNSLFKAATLIGSDNDGRPLKDVSCKMTLMDLAASSLLSANDVVDGRRLWLRLRDGSDALCTYIRAKSAKMPQLAMVWPGHGEADDCQLAASVARILNEVISERTLYSESGFSGVALRRQTKWLVQTEPHDVELRHLNRMLLEDAFPRELSRHSVSSVEFSEEHDVRVAVSAEFMNAPGAFAAVESFYEPRKSPRRWCSVVWVYDEVFEIVLGKVCALLGHLEGERALCDVAADAYLDGELTSLRVNESFPEKVKALALGNNASELILKSSSIAVVIDITPLEKVEFQVSVTFEAKNWTQAIAEHLGKAMAGSRCVPVDEDIYVELLEYLAVVLKLGTKEQHASQAT